MSAKIKKPLIISGLTGILSGWQDSNLRPPAPKAGAIPGYATPRTVSLYEDAKVKNKNAFQNVLEIFFRRRVSST